MLDRGTKAQRPVWRPILGLSRVFHSPCPPPQSLTDRSTRRDIYHTAKQFGFIYFQKRNCARPFSPNFHIHVSVSDLNRHQDRIHRKGNKLERRPVLFAVVFFGSILLPFHSACRLYCTCFTERLHRKKRLSTFPSPAGMSLSLGGNTVLPPTESLVSDIPAGDGNVDNLFFQCNNGYYGYISLQPDFGKPSMKHR